MGSLLDRWSDVCRKIRESGTLTELAFSLWIDRICPLAIDETERSALLRVETDFHRRLLSECEVYRALFRDAFSASFGVPFTVTIVCEPETQTEVALGAPNTAC